MLQQHVEDPGEYQNLRPKDFYREFHRQADDDDKAIVSEVPYQLRQLARFPFRTRGDTFRHQADRLLTILQNNVSHCDTLRHFG